MSEDLPDWLRAARDKWSNRGQERPPFAIEPGPGQRSVWDFPRPPALEPTDVRIDVFSLDGSRIVQSPAALAVLETSHPPSYYVPPTTVAPGSLVPAPGRSHCEWKGEAIYLAAASDPDTAIGWCYPEPYPEFADYAGWISFYPARARCFADGEPARPQAGGFYGGWVTNDLVGPFKGEPGTEGW